MDRSRPGRRATNPRSARLPATTILAWGVGVPTLLVLGGGTLYHVVTGGDVSTTSVVLPVAGITSLSVGEVLVTRLPRHRIAWLLWLIGMLTSITVITQGLADLGLSNAPGSVPGAVWFAWVGAWAGGPALFIPAILLPLLYPTGQPPSPRWWPVVRVGIGVIAAWSLAAAFGPFPSGSYPPDVRSPLAIPGTAGDLLAQHSTVLAPLLFVLLMLALTSVAVRYRRAIGVEREQIRWFAFIGSVAIMALVIAGGASGITDGPAATIDNAAWLVGIGALALLPVAIGIAVLRYRLYEIDRLISRSISYASLSAIIAGMFVGLVLLLQDLLAPVTGSNELAVAGSTLAVAAFFQPLRHRLQALIDRRFNRARVDAERSAAAFADRLRDEVNLEQIEAETIAAVSLTLQPAVVSLWLRS